MSYMKIESLPDPGDRYTLQDELGTGVCAKVFKAIDTQSEDKIVAIKIQRYEEALAEHIQEEYRILRDLSSHPNLPDFYGVYLKKSDTDDVDEIWFIIEYCQGGPIVDFIRSLHTINRRLSEEHIAFILREAAKGLLHLHKNHFIHRDVKGGNILLTKEGEIKLCDFGLTRDIKDTMGKRGTCIGSPCWMAPEVFTNTSDEEEEVYGIRADVWSLGITAIELGDGKPPFLDMHPTRAMFQILRNPPPTLYRPSNWGTNYNDFIAECLEKNPENRPLLVEMMEHPFFTELSENDYHLNQEIKMRLEDVASIAVLRREEIAIRSGQLLKYNTKPQPMYVEDLAALDKVTEEIVLAEIEHRMQTGTGYTFVGDVLLSINTNDMPENFDRKFHNKYLFKSRSDNSPHIFAVADRAFQDMLHHEDPQHIMLSGESYSGKTANAKLLMKHLLLLGEGNKGIDERVKSSYNVVETLINAGTPINPNSTRSVFQTTLTFGSTGKLSGVVYSVYLLEKLRVSTTDMNQHNFHIFYYFYDAMEAAGKLDNYKLEPGRKYRYLRIPEEQQETKLSYYRDDAAGNVDRLKELETNLLSIDFHQEQIDNIYEILAAILMLGEVRYKVGDGSSKVAELEDPEIAQRVAELLKVDEKKFQWALVNYCVVEKGTAERRRHTSDEARDARDVLAGTIYTRLVDWIINTIDHKLALGRAVYGDSHSISINDMFGFECFHRNGTEQLMINSLNEQMQYVYNQRMFMWEMIEHEEEEVPAVPLHFYDNKLAVDQLLNKPNGLFSLVDEATRNRHGYEYLTDAISQKKVAYVKRVNGHEFSVAHYTGKVTYDARHMIEKNRDFVPPEMVEVLRLSTDAIVKVMFTNQLSKTGNLTMAYEHEPFMQTKKSKWGAALVAEKVKEKDKDKEKVNKLNTLSHGQYSQIHKMRTLASVFRATSLELIKGLSISASSSGTHFVRCIRSNLEYKQNDFQSEMVRQQLKAMAILDTAIARQKGYPQRIPFQEFLRRYQFLGFEFNENVEMTKDNCRLLLLRLKMEGWLIGKTKVFLKYYNVEYLSRLYETQVKKIVKVQSMMRAFLAKRNVASKLKKIRQDSVNKKLKKQISHDMAQEDAVLRIQKAYRGYAVRKKYSPLINAKTGKMDEETAAFIKDYAKRWKAKSIFQVLLHYRAAKYQDLVNFSQQVHIFNQAFFFGLSKCSNCVISERIDSKETNKALLGKIRPPIWKIPFRLDEIPFFDTTYLCDPLQKGFTSTDDKDSDDEPWDAPLRRRATISSRITSSRISCDNFPKVNDSEYTKAREDIEIVNEPFSRDPDVSIKRKAPKPPCQPVGYVSNIYSPTPYVQNIREKFDESNVSVVGSNSVQYKKRPAPKAPSFENVSTVQEPEWLKSQKKRQAPQPIKFREAPPERSSLNVITNKKITAPTIQPNVNPIKEMEEKAKRTTDENLNEIDDPPFNFQGMLRKTKYNRASMKRATDQKLTTSGTIDFTDGLDDLNNNNVPINRIFRSRTPDDSYVETSNNYTNVVYHSKQRPKSSQGIMSPMIITSSINIEENDNQQKDNQRKLYNQDMEYDDDDCEMENNSNLGPYIKEEIAPGIILEGYIAHI